MSHMAVAEVEAHPHQKAVLYFPHQEQDLAALVVVEMVVIIHPVHRTYMPIREFLSLAAVVAVDM
jgi:hypothetical protein